MPPAPGSPSDWKGTYFIGRYRVVDEIGVGGMASVYLARVDGAGGFQKWVAIKRIHPHLTENENVVRMFLDEARIAASISHPNVAQVFDLGQHEGGYWIAMEYLHGEPVREIFRHREQLGAPSDPRLVARIISDAAEGLHAAHDLRGKDGNPLHLVHRDVSPHNLFVTYDGVVKVVDFGIAKVSGRQVQTRVGVLRGKLAYMSPEQARCANIDRRTDVFALGVVAWELLTGRRLFRAKNDLETVHNVLTAPIQPPSKVHPGVPPELEAAVMRALERDEARRFQTAREFSRALQQFLVATGQLVGPQEIAAFLASIFHERISMREAHLKWAAEVTQTLNLDQLLPAGPPGSTTAPRPPSAGSPGATASVAMPLVRQRQPESGDQGEWDQPTVPRGKVASPTPAPPEPPEDDDLVTEVGPTWGVERDRVVRSLVEVGARTAGRPALPARAGPKPSPAAPPAAAAKASSTPAAVPPPVAAAPPPPVAAAPPPPVAAAPLAPGAEPSTPITPPWGRYMLAAAGTFLLVAALSLAAVFAFRTRIRSALGLRPTSPPASAPSHS